jgi:hypothetical protein
MKNVEKNDKEFCHTCENIYTPCVPMLNKQKYHIFISQNQRKGGQNRSCLGVWYQWKGEGVGKGHGRMNSVQILCTQVCRWKNDTCWTIPGMGGWRRRMVKEINSSMIHLLYCKNFCKCHNVPPPSTILKNMKNKICQERKHTLSSFNIFVDF